MNAAKTSILREDKIRLYDFEKICAYAADYTGQEFCDEKTMHRALVVVAKVNGHAYRGWNTTKETFEVRDELIEFRLLALSNYKSVYVKCSPELFDFLFNKPNAKDDYARSRHKHANEYWYEAARHDSCWTEGFSLSRLFEYESTFEIVEMGMGEIDYTPEEGEYTYENRDKKEKMLLGELWNIESWNIDSTSRWNLYASFMKEMATRSYTKGFRVTLKQENTDRFIERDLRIFFDYNGEGIMYTLTKNRQKKSVRIFIDDFSLEKVESIYPGYTISFVGKAFFPEEETLGRLVSDFVFDGYEVSVKKK